MYVIFYLRYSQRYFEFPGPVSRLLGALFGTFCNTEATTYNCIHLYTYKCKLEQVFVHISI